MASDKPLVFQTPTERIETYTFEIVKTRRVLQNIKTRLQKVELGELQLNEGETVELLQERAVKAEKRIQKLKQFRDKYQDSDLVEAEIERLQQKVDVYQSRIDILKGKISELEEHKETL